MNEGLIIITDYCQNSVAEPQFIHLLETEGLIEIIVENGSEYILESQISLLDKYSRWHYELSINIEGIGVVQNLLEKIDSMQGEIRNLKRQIHLLDSLVESDFRNL